MRQAEPSPRCRSPSNHHSSTRGAVGEDVDDGGTVVAVALAVAKVAFDLGAVGTGGGGGVELAVAVIPHRYCPKSSC